MANAEHAPAMASPVRTDEQIVPRNRWVPIGKSNCYLNEEKSQPNPIFKIAVDILKQTNFFRAFTQRQHHTAAIKDSPITGATKKLDHIPPATSCNNFPTQDPTLHYLCLQRTRLVFLKFSAKTKQKEVLWDTIPNELINNVIRGADYYDAYLEKVAMHQRYIAGEELSDPESLAPKPAKPIKQAKPKATEQPTVSKTKARSLKSSTGHTKRRSTSRGPLPPVVFRETDIGKFQPLPEVPGKGKEKVGREDSTSLYAELGLYGSDTESDEEMPSVVRSGAHDEGQAGSDLVNQPRIWMRGFTAMAITLMYRESKAKQFAEQMIPKGPVTLSRERCLLYNISQKNFSLCYSTRPSIIPSYDIPMIQISCLDLTHPMFIGLYQPPQPQLQAQQQQHLTDYLPTNHLNSNKIDQKINESVKEVVISSVKHAMRAPLRARFKDLLTSYIKEILLQRMLEENYDKGHTEHRIAYEALQGSIHRDECEDFDEDKDQEETKKKGKQDSLKPPLGSPPSPPPPPLPPSEHTRASAQTDPPILPQAPPPPHLLLTTSSREISIHALQPQVPQSQLCVDND
ncbi:hypothetical protein Tco_0954343 [Tanacetum coccineum]|uniref:Uncharacterized protein n=1 Tax=Tanacetum coccineum TaxID=301880 RepID=A0ABQ5E3W2_9ASTR